MAADIRSKLVIGLGGAGGGTDGKAGGIGGGGMFAHRGASLDASVSRTCPPLPSAAHASRTIV